MGDTERLPIAVIGAGIVGLCTALELRNAGHDILLIEPGEPGGTQAASYGNATWLSPGAIAPISLPGLWRKVPGYLLDPGGPFTIRARDLPDLTPWLARFVLAGRTWDRVAACAAARWPLCRDTVGGHTAYASEAGVPDLVRRDGLTYVYPDRAAFEAERRIWDMRRAFGVRISEVDEAALRRLHPDLSPAYRFGARLDEAGRILDPAGYARALARRLEARGARLIRARATGFSLEQGRLTGVTTDAGHLPARSAVIAAGIGSRALAAKAGDAVPLISERGYHVVVPSPGFALAGGLMPSDGQMGIVTTPQGLRVAGQVELARAEAPPNWPRADILLGFARRMFPAHADAFAEARVERWMGHRPSTPDGLPCIGRSRGSPDIIHAFGHGHTGMTQAPATAKLVTALVGGDEPPFDPAPYSARRFA